MTDPKIYKKVQKEWEKKSREFRAWCDKLRKELEEKKNGRKD